MRRSASCRWFSRAPGLSHDVAPERWAGSLLRHIPRCGARCCCSGALPAWSAACTATLRGDGGLITPPLPARPAHAPELHRSGPLESAHHSSCVDALPVLAIPAPRLHPAVRRHTRPRSAEQRLTLQLPVHRRVTRTPRPPRGPPPRHDGQRPSGPTNMSVVEVAEVGTGRVAGRMGPCALPPPGLGF